MLLKDDCHTSKDGFAACIQLLRKREYQEQGFQARLPFQTAAWRPHCSAGLYGQAVSTITQTFLPIDGRHVVQNIDSNWVVGCVIMETASQVGSLGRGTDTDEADNEYTEELST